MDIRRILELLEASGYEGWYVLEQDVMLGADPGSGPKEDVRRSLEFLSKVIQSA